MINSFLVIMIAVVGGITVYLVAAHQISYRLMKNRIVSGGSWDLNISCGKTDGGGVNADIVSRPNLPNFVKVEDIYNLPFRDKQFETVLCSHTIEHVDDPEAFFRELSRVGKTVTLVVPPLWDPGASFALRQHKWVFLTFRKVHHSLPPKTPLPCARWLQRRTGQSTHA